MGIDVEDTSRMDPQHVLALGGQREEEAAPETEQHRVAWESGLWRRLSLARGMLLVGRQGCRLRASVIRG